jgi:Uma2 family endonuclease
MSSGLPRPLLRIAYEKAAEEYLRSLPPEHFMEATAQATQRGITLASLALVKARRPDVHVFNELLIQYPLRGQKKPGQVVPDNMVVVWQGPITAGGSFDLPFQPTGPLWVLEYVSKHSQRKDYEDSFQKYERGLKVPYYLLFYPDSQDVTLYRYSGRRYVTVKPNERERYALPQLDLEVALLDGWVRYWYQGELLPLPADLQRDLDETRRRLDEATRRADEEARRAESERQARLAAEEEVARLRAQLEQLQARPKEDS